jgi:hypothetical protein
MFCQISCSGLMLARTTKLFQQDQHSQPRYAMQMVQLVATAFGWLGSCGASQWLAKRCQLSTL